jgi:hypothetical protein
MTSEARTTAIAWGLSPISLIILCLLSLWLGALSISAIIITGVIVFAYGLVTFRFLRCLYRSNIAKNTSWIRVALILAAVAPVTYFAFRQFLSYRILHSQSSRSVFDEVWDSADQIAYGYPSPFLRFFDVADQLHGKTLIDWVSLMMIIWLALFFVFLSLASIGITLRFITKMQNKPAHPTAGNVLV